MESCDVASTIHESLSGGTNLPVQVHVVGRCSLTQSNTPLNSLYLSA